MNAIGSTFAIGLGWAAGVFGAWAAQPVQPAIALPGDELSAIIPDAQIFLVQATDCARPLFDDGVALITEAAPFELLAPGDIVVFRDAETGQTIVERVLARRDEAHVTAGPARAAIGRSAYIGRVFGVFYTRGPHEERPVADRDEGPHGSPR